MKKILLFYAFMFIIMLAPRVVLAAPAICTGGVGGDGYCATARYGVGQRYAYDYSGMDVTQYYYTVNGQTVFCIDARNQYPLYVDRARNLNMNSSIDKGLAAIYRVYLVEAANGANHDRVFNLANDAMRLFIRKYNALSQPYPGENTYRFDGYTNTLTNSAQSGDRAVLQKMLCAGIYASGNSLSSVCNGRLDSEEKRFLTMDNFSFTIMTNNESEQQTVDSSKPYSKEITLNISGTGYNNMKSLFANYPSLKSGSYINVTGCDVDSASKAAGFTCRLSGNGQNLLATEEQKVIIEGNNTTTNDTDVTVSISYRYHVPYDVSSLTMLKCSGASGICRSGLTTQRFIIMDKDKILTVRANPKNCTPATDPACPPTITVTVPSACRFEVENGQPKYYFGGQEVSEKEYIVEKHCCDVNPNYMRDQEAILEYRNFCQENDIVYFENECGTKSKLGTSIDKVTSGGNVSTTTCTNESYVDYTHSYIWQLSMAKIMDRVKTLESVTYAQNLEGMYTNSAIANHLDKSYLQSSVKGSSGETLAAATPSNNYCMLYTSEENNLYFPGTAISTSGRYFVFNELNKSECTDAINPGANCFRQPYVVGQIYTTMHTNFVKWDKDYKAAIEAEKNAYNTWQASGLNSDKQLYDTAKEARETLEKYKTECEQRNDVEKYWNYNLSPTLSFNYKQKVYGGEQRSEMIKETVGMEISNSKEKYWPNASTETKVISGSKSGSRKNTTYTISYGSVNETKTFDSTTDYSVGFEKTIYYRPKQVTYATIPTGQYVIRNEEYQTGAVDMIENGLKVGYVYNVRLTTYEGAYSTSFVIDNVGHIGLDGVSNVQKSLETYKQDNNLDELSSECVYCNQEGEFKRVCEACPDPNNPDLSASYIYRTISLSDVTPNDRANTNWSDAKGKSAEERIESLSGPNIVANLSNNNLEPKVVTLNEASTSNAKIEELAVGNIYDDSTREYLEYEFTLTTADMQMIKKNTARSDFDYGSMNMCGAGGKVVAKDASANYCFVCNKDGKECESSFIDSYADTATTQIARESKWKYFINNKWYIDSWNNIINKYPEVSKLEGFEDGRYPDPLNPDAYLKIYSNWP